MMTPVIAGQVVVDRCPEHGQWLDPGELGRLLDAPRAIELEAFYERFSPDAELPARLLEFRKMREGERARRAAELDEYRAKVEAEQAGIRAEQAAERAAERAVMSELAEQERRAILTKQRMAIQRAYEETERTMFARERELARDRERIEEQVAQLATLRETTSNRERALADLRARLTYLEGQLRELGAALKSGPP
jgi:Zn-finger nucleic acid-binding protein